MHFLEAKPKTLEQISCFYTFSYFFPIKYFILKDSSVTEENLLLTFLNLYFTFLIIDIFTRNLCISKFELPLWILAAFHIFVYNSNRFVLYMPNVSLSSLTFSLSRFGHFMINLLKTFYSKGIVYVIFFENNMY